MPQALVLMNSQLFQSMLQPHTQLSLNLAAASGDDDAQCGCIFQTLLARKPSAREQAAWTRARQSGLTSVEDLVYALINTQQFIFIQ